MSPVVWDIVQGGIVAMVILIIVMFVLLIISWCTH